MNPGSLHGVYLAGLLALAIASGCGSGSSDDWVVEIDDGGIPLRDLRRVVDARVEEEGEQRRAEILNEELERLVGEQVGVNRARELGIEISDAEVLNWLRRLHGADFTTSDQAYLEEVHDQLMRDRAALLDLADRVRVPEDALLNHFEENRERYETPARVQIRQIVVEDEAKAEQLHAELGNGADFAALAEEHSLAPEASEGGLVPPFARGEMPEAFERAFALRIDEVSEVVESPYGFHIFLLVARTPARETDFAEVRDQIEAELQSERLGELRRGWLRDLRMRARIQVNERMLETLR